MWLEAIHECGADGHKCPTCGGEVQRRAYGEMYAGAFVLDGQRVEIRRTPIAGFIDPIVLDPLTQYFDGGLYRVWPSSPYYTRGGKFIHRDVWRTAFGPIPTGCHIHHRDSDLRNNQLSNLECLPAAEHLKIDRRPTTFTDGARAAAAEWHRSEEGRLWHRRHAERSKSWTKWKREDRPCPECGVIFSALIRKSGNAQIYCSSACKVAAYRERSRAWSANYRERKKAAGAV